MRARQAADLQRNVLNAIRDSLFDDPYIIETAETYGFPEGKRITLSEKKEGRCLVFYVKAAFFEDWLKRHSDCIGTSFTLRTKPHPYSTNVKESSTQAKRTRQGRFSVDTAVIAKAKSTTSRAESRVERRKRPDCVCLPSVVTAGRPLKLRLDHGQRVMACPAIHA